MAVTSHQNHPKPTWHLEKKKQLEISPLPNLARRCYVGFGGPTSNFKACLIAAGHARTKLWDCLYLGIPLRCYLPHLPGTNHNKSGLTMIPTTCNFSTACAWIKRMRDLASAWPSQFQFHSVKLVHDALSELALEGRTYCRWCRSEGSKGLRSSPIHLPKGSALGLKWVSLGCLRLPKGRAAQRRALPTLWCKGVGRHRALAKIPWCNSRGNSRSRPWSRPKRRLRLLCLWLLLGLCGVTEAFQGIRLDLSSLQVKAIRNDEFCAGWEPELCGVAVKGGQTLQTSSTILLPIGVGLLASQGHAGSLWLHVEWTCLSAFQTFQGYPRPETS